MAFCENCGRPLADGEVCNCTQAQASEQGTAQTDTAEAEGVFANEPVVKNEPKNKGKKGFAVAVVVLVIIVVGSVAAFLHIANGYKRPINDITSAVNKKTTDVDSFVAAVLPDFAASSYKKAVKIMKTSEDFTESYDGIGTALSAYYEQLDESHENGWVVKFDYADKEKLEAEELEIIQNSYEGLYTLYFEALCERIDDYDKYDYEDLAASLGITTSKAKDLCKVAVNFMEEFEDVKVTAGYSLTGRIVLTDKGGDTLEKSDKMNVRVVKLNGDWMIDYLSLIDELNYNIWDLGYLIDGLY